MYCNCWVLSFSLPSTSSWSASAQDTASTSWNAGLASRSPVILAVGASLVPPWTSSPSQSRCSLLSLPSFSSRATRTPSEDTLMPCTERPTRSSTATGTACLSRTISTRGPAGSRSTTYRSPRPSQVGEVSPSSPFEPGRLGVVSTGCGMAGSESRNGTVKSWWPSALIAAARSPSRATATAPSGRPLCCARPSGPCTGSPTASPRVSCSTPSSARW